MAKTNYTKVENFLDEGMRRITVNKLLDEADEASGKSPKAKSTLTQRQKDLIRYIDVSLKRLRAVDKKIYSKLKLKKSTLDPMLKNPADLKKLDWKHLAGLKKKLETLQKKYFPEKSDQELIESEKVRHTKKRFNVKEDWIPFK